MQVDEFKALVKELHRNGIEVILDVVFNHTAEGNEHGPTHLLPRPGQRIYYMLTPEGHYNNFTGCGNTLNCNHPVVRDFILDCLRHWVADYHIDGFRFDLASILGRDQNGAPLRNPPLLEALADDPVLGKTQADRRGVGRRRAVPGRHVSRPTAGGRSGTAGTATASASSSRATRARSARWPRGWSGSPDLYRGRGPTASINFVTCHDGFTLTDLVSYNDKHNEANGEDNRDGANDNHSLELRRRRADATTRRSSPCAAGRCKNALAMLLLSQGVPMLLMGDECGRTQQGNNNAYCQDNPLTWLDWTLLEQERRAVPLLPATDRLSAATPGAAPPLPPRPWRAPATSCR